MAEILIRILGSTNVPEDRNLIQYDANFGMEDETEPRWLNYASAMGLAYATWNGGLAYSAEHFAEKPTLIYAAVRVAPARNWREHPKDDYIIPLLVLDGDYQTIFDEENGRTVRVWYVCKVRPLGNNIVKREHLKTAWGR